VARLARILILAPILLVPLHFAWHFLVVDDCLDGSGAYDYVQRVCITEGEGPVPHLPYYRAFAPELILAALSVLIGVVLKRRVPDAPTRPVA
jgi:hypothetical protein